MVRQLTLLDYISPSDIMVFTVEVEPRCLKVFDNIRYEIIDRKRGVLVLKVYMPRSLRHKLLMEYIECMLR